MQDGTAKDIMDATMVNTKQVVEGTEENDDTTVLYKTARSISDMSSDTKRQFSLYGRHGEEPGMPNTIQDGCGKEGLMHHQH